MTCIGNGMGLAAFLLFLACPQVLLGLNSAPSARQLSCKTRQRDAGPVWLVGRGSGGTDGMEPSLCLDGRVCAALDAPSTRFSWNEAGNVKSTSRPLVLKQTGIYGLEFGTAVVGAAVSAVGALYVSGTFLNKGEDLLSPSVFVAGGLYALASTLMSSAGTCLIGGLFGQGGSCGRSLAGGACGGVVGGGVLVCLMATNDPPLVLVPVGLTLPALGSVVGYNTRRNR